MDDYIKREDVKQMLCSFCREPECHSMCNVPIVVRLLPTADVVERPRWIPVKERLPEDGTWQIFTDGKNISVERYKMDIIDHFFPPSSWFSFDDVTHWMPLPEPPKEEE